MSIITNCAAMGTLDVTLQNGVGGGAGLSSPQIPMISPGDSLGGDGHKRPSKLSVLTHKLSATKTMPESSEDEGGSLPCTPESHSADGPDLSKCPAGDEAALDADTRQLLSCFMADFTGTRRAQWRESKALATMKRVVGSLMEKHRYVYKGRRPGLCVEAGQKRRPPAGESRVRRPENG